MCSFEDHKEYVGLYEVGKISTHVKIRGFEVTHVASDVKVQ